jgi:hypothetical protein
MSILMKKLMIVLQFKTPLNMVKNETPKSFIKIKNNSQYRVTHSRTLATGARSLKMQPFLHPPKPDWNTLG